MDDTLEIDLRKLIQQLLKRWWLILGSAALLAVLAFVVTSIMPASYQATALVAVTQPRYQLNFDPKIQTLYSTQPASNAYLDLAASDDVLIQVYDQWPERPDNIKDLQDFREKAIQVSSGKDASILKLIVKTESAGQSARLANLWAAAALPHCHAYPHPHGHGEGRFHQRVPQCPSPSMWPRVVVIWDTKSRRLSMSRLPTP